ncbi:Nn.00g116700.m01.CDS01 [Neocucurbitaria sp. VM-36]
MAHIESEPSDLIAHIKDCYHAYRHTVDIDSKGLFFSSNCLQICRPTPSFAATTRKEIVQYLRDAQKGKIPVETPSASSKEILDATESQNDQTKSGTEAKGRSVYTIRPLQPLEFEFSTDDITAPVNLTAEELRHKAKQEKWTGMRVDLWDEGDDEAGLLVKVQYWWRLEEIPQNEQMVGETIGHAWRQCLHDIIYMGPKDGTEGADGQEILE